MRINILTSWRWTSVGRWSAPAHLAFPSAGSKAFGLQSSKSSWYIIWVASHCWFIVDVLGTRSSIVHLFKRAEMSLHKQEGIAITRQPWVIWKKLSCQQQVNVDSCLYSLLPSGPTFPPECTPARVSLTCSRRHQSQDLPCFLLTPPTPTLYRVWRACLCVSMREIRSEQTGKVGEKKPSRNPFRVVLSVKAQTRSGPCGVGTVWKN